MITRALTSLHSGLQYKDMMAEKTCMNLRTLITILLRPGWALGYSVSMGNGANMKLC